MLDHGASGRDTKVLGNSGVSSPLGPVFNPSKYSGGNPENGLDFLKYIPKQIPSTGINDNKKQSSVRTKKKRKTRTA